MAQPTFRSFIGIAKDTINANLSIGYASGSSSLVLNNVVGTPTTSMSMFIVDGVLTENAGAVTSWTSGTSTLVLTGTTANTHSANAYVYFQLTASIGPTAYIPVTKIDASDTYAQLYDKGYRGSNTSTFGASQGMRMGKVSLDGDIFADSFGYILGSFFGAYDYTATTGGNPTIYGFSQLNTGNGQPPPYLFYDYNPGANNTRVFAKAVVSDVTIKADPGGLLGHTTTIASFASGVLANPSTIPPVFSAFTTIPARVSTVTIGGSITAKVKTYEAALKREEFGEINTLQGLQDPLAIWAGPSTCTGKMTLVVDDDVQLLNYINASQPSVLLTATQGTGTAANGIKIQNTHANYEGVKPVQSGGYVTLDVSYTALANSTDKSTAGGGLSPVLLTLNTGLTTGATIY